MYPDWSRNIADGSVIQIPAWRDLDNSGFMEAFGMGKDLSKMTLEELWALFPIFLVPHDDRWKDSFNEIEKTLTGLLAAQPVVRISHIGSTAI